MQGDYQRFRRPIMGEQIQSEYDFDSSELADLIARDIAPFQVFTIDLSTQPLNGVLVLPVPGRAFVPYFWQTNSTNRTRQPSGLINVAVNSDGSDTIQVFPAKHNRGFRGSFATLALTWANQANTSVDFVVHKSCNTPWMTDDANLAAGGVVASVTASSPLTSSGGVNPNIAITDTTGAAQFLAGPTGAAGAVTERAMVVGDLPSAIPYSKLTLTNSIVNADIAAAAAIAYSKLNLAASIVDADISALAAISNSKLANMAAHTFKGNNTGAPAAPIDLTATQLTAELNTMTGGAGTGLKGLVPAQVAGDVAKWLSGAGTFNSFVPTPSFFNLGLSASIASNILTVALKQSDGSTDASAANPVIIPFRSATATTGAMNVRSVTAALSLTVGTTASLGLPTATSNKIYIYALDNSGTVELFASAHPFWDEGTVQSTSTTNTSNSVLFGANARASMPIRLLGYVQATWTSGTGWSALAAVGPAPFNKTRITFKATATGQTPKALGSATAYALTSANDPYNGFNGSNTWTAMAAGRYLVYWMADGGSAGSSGANAVMGANIILNGAITDTVNIRNQATGTFSNWPCTVLGDYTLAVGDTIVVNHVTNFTTPGTTAFGTLVIERMDT